jgi:thymidylate synthase
MTVNNTRLVLSALSVYDPVAEDFILEEYNPHPTIKAEMAV